MYLVGAEHPNKSAAALALRRLALAGERLVTDAEVLQEILHRYCAIGRREAIDPAFEALTGVVDEVLPIDLAAATIARELATSNQSLSARDAIHVATMRIHGIDSILSFDEGFDAVPGIRRTTT